MPSAVSRCWAALRVAWSARVLLRPPNGHCGTSVPNVRRCNVAQSSRGFTFFFGGTLALGPVPLGVGFVSMGCFSTTGRSDAFKAEYPVTTRQMQFHRGL
jgi:hypothetical protein